MRAIGLAFLFLPFSAFSQPSARHQLPDARFDQALMLFEADAFGASQHRFEDFLALSHQPGTAAYISDQTRAELLRALAARRAGSPEAEHLLRQFIERYSPQPVALEAIRQVADMAFAERDYKKASSYYEQLPLDALTARDREEVRFRLGYTAFAAKNFREAERYLGDLRNSDGEYAEPARYYYALSRFYQDDFAGARRGFESLKNSKRYAKVIPGNLAQIYFAEGDYQEVIDYAAPLANSSRLRGTDQLQLLVGRSYFEQGKYADALPYLEAYASRSRKMSAEDFYQLGYAQYQTGNYAVAADNFVQLGNENTAIGQLALYYLGDAYLRLDRPADARPAFSRVTRLDFNENLREEAAWNVAKLNYELGYNQEALAALRSVPPTSNHYREAQELLSRVILNSRDYAGALEVLSQINNPSARLQETRQQVLVLRGLQLLEQGKTKEARTLLLESLQTNGKAYYKALASYWIGDVAYRQGKYDAAIRYLSDFQRLAAGVNTAFPTTSNEATANYTLGYAYLRQEKYGRALSHFQKAVSELRRRLELTGKNSELKRLLGDAVVRAGDANFKQNNYPAALKYYDEAVQNKYPGYVYALYQRAMVEGLQGQSTEKIISLERIADDYPNSPYADEALYELGITYQSINQLKLAHQTLRRLLDEKKDSPLRNEALLRLGIISFNQGNTQRAIEYYKQVFANTPRANELRRAQDALQEIYVETLGQPNEYFTFLESIPGRSLNVSLKDSISFTAANTKYENAEYDRAITLYSAYLADFPQGSNVPTALYRRADAYLIREDYAAALADLDALLSRGESPYRAPALAKAARLAYDYRQDFDKAYSYSSELLESSPRPDDYEALRQLALQSAYRSGKFKATSRLTEEILRDETTSADARALAAFYTGKLAFDRKEYDKALGNFNTVIRNTDSEQAAESRYLVARIYFLRDDLDLAETVTVQAQRQSSGYPYWVAKSTLLLVDIFLAKKDYLSAQAVAEGLVANYRGDAELEAEARAKLETVLEVSAANSRITPTDSTTIDLLDPESN